MNFHQLTRRPIGLKIRRRIPNKNEMLQWLKHDMKSVMSIEVKFSYDNSTLLLLEFSLSSIVHKLIMMNLYWFYKLHNQDPNNKGVQLLQAWPIMNHATSLSGKATKQFYVLNWNPFRFFIRKIGSKRFHKFIMCFSN